jgi:DinB family protein
MQSHNSKLARVARAGVYAVCLAAGAAAGLSLHSFSARAQQKNGALPATFTNSQIPSEVTGLYCNLKAFTPEERVRHEQLSKKLREARIEVKELSNGFAFGLQANAMYLADVAEWVSGERKCCPFFDFRIDLQKDGGPLWLELSGKEGVKQFIRSEFALPATQTAAPAEHPEMARTVTQVLDFWVTNTEKLLVATADAMPEERYSFAPAAGEFKGVRTFAEQVKHLAAANYQLGAAILGEEPPVGTKGEAAPDSVRSKEEIMRYLRGSFACLHRAAAAIDEKSMDEPVAAKGNRTRLWLIVDALVHSSNHYGQIVEYLRMNGIVPPASR